MLKSYSVPGYSAEYSLTATTPHDSNMLWSNWAIRRISDEFLSFYRFPNAERADSVDGLGTCVRAVLGHSRADWPS